MQLIHQIQQSYNISSRPFASFSNYVPISLFIKGEKEIEGAKEKRRDDERVIILLNILSKKEERVLLYFNVQRNFIFVFLSYVNGVQR